MSRGDMDFTHLFPSDLESIEGYADDTSLSTRSGGLQAQRCKQGRIAAAKRRTAAEKPRPANRSASK